MPHPYTILHIPYLLVGPLVGCQVTYKERISERVHTPGIWANGSLSYPTSLLHLLPVWRKHLLLLPLPIYCELLLWVPSSSPFISVLCSVRDSRNQLCLLPANISDLPLSLVSWVFVLQWEERRISCVESVRKKKRGGRNYTENRNVTSPYAIYN